MKKPVIISAARAIVDLLCSCGECDCEALADATVRYLQSCGCTRRDLRAFLGVLRRELRKKGMGLTVQLTTPTGECGTYRETLKRALEQALRYTPELKERKDSSLLGGAILAYGDERFDASLRGALAQLGRDLLMPIS